MTSKNLLLVTQDLIKEYPGIKAINKISLEVFSGQLLAILGPSGCGKSTLLQLIAGLEKPDNGTISYAGKLWVKDSFFVVPEKRDCGMVFQDMALFPHLSVAENIGFAVPRRQQQGVVREMLDLVGLPGVENRMVYELSGGQQQRVALARSLAPEPGLLLLDEPFSSLDFQLRQSMRREVRKILKQQKVTAILVTHDQNEAFAFADSVAVMFAGQIEQQGNPEAIYRQPATKRSAAFVGDANFTPMKEALTCFPRLKKIPSVLQLPENIFMCRPEDCLLNKKDPVATVIDTEFQGAWQEVQLKTDCGELLTAHSRTFWKEGQRLAVDIGYGCVYSSQGNLLATV